MRLRTTLPPRRMGFHPLLRPGFTLIEILVVIAIIAVLVSLTSAAVFKVLGAGRKGVTQTRMSQMTEVLGSYKSSRKVGYIPSFGSGTGGSFRLRASYTSMTTPNDTSVEAVYLKQVFPNLNLAATGLTSADLNPNQTFTFFLTGGVQLQFKGFSTNPQQPFSPLVSGSGQPEQRIGPFIEGNPKYVNLTTGELIDGWGRPYMYFSSGERGYATTAFGGVTPYSFAGNFLNPKGFQIISAGPDGQFGAGGTAFPATGVGADDLGNWQTSVLGTVDK